MQLLLLYLSKHSLSIPLFEYSVSVLTSSYQNTLFITDVYICRQSIFPIDELIICQNAGKKCFLLHYLKDALTRSLFLFFGIIIVIKLEVDVLLIKSQSHCMQ